MRSRKADGIAARVVRHICGWTASVWPGTVAAVPATSLGPQALAGGGEKVVDLQQVDHAGQAVEGGVAAAYAFAAPACAAPSVLRSAATRATTSGQSPTLRCR